MASRPGGEGALRRLFLAAGALMLAAAVGAGPAGAVILPPSTIDGPSTAGLILGGVAMASDGTGGLVYTKTVEGRPHVFASRYDGVNWSAPIRVDTESPYEASEPRIAAGDGGRLLVVWVAPVATLANGELRRALFSSSLGGGSEGFAPQLVVDPNVRSGAGTTPSLAGTVPGKAIVAYRVITHTFGNLAEASNAVQLRPGDVLADIRVARLEGDRWSRLGAINRNPAASMRAPTETNGPQVAIDSGGRAALAWQEPDATGAARVWVRRIDGTTLGPIYPASPETFGGRPVSEDATAFAIGVTPTDRVRVAARVDGTSTSPLGGQRVFLTSFGSRASTTGAKPKGPELADGGVPASPVGPPALAAVDDDGVGTEGALDLAYATGTSLRSVAVNPQGALVAPTSIPGPPPVAGTPVVAAADPDGGSAAAYLGSGAGGLPIVGVSQTLPEGEVQTAQLSGPIGGSITQLLGATSGSGDALVAFRQGESGSLAIVADRVAAPPGTFAASVPKSWVSPKRAWINWPEPESSVGGLSYDLLVEGREVGSSIAGQRVRPAAGEVGSGQVGVQIKATDRFGGVAITAPAELKVDAEPPALKIAVRRAAGVVSLRLTDDESGLRTGATRISFGDGTKKRGHAVVRHKYDHAGTYTVEVRAVDRVGNVLTQRDRVAVG